MSTVLHSTFDSEQQRGNWLGSLRSLASALEGESDRLAVKCGGEYRIGYRQTAATFVRWERWQRKDSGVPVSEGVQPNSENAVNLLQSLIEFDPVFITNSPRDGNPRDPAIFWPEGYVYVSLCLKLLLLESGTTDGELNVQSHELGRIENWWSFRENAEEDPAAAAEFLNVFAGS